MTPRTGQVKPLFRLRWVFHWADGKVKQGIWNGSTNRFEDTAAYLNKTGLLVAQIQSEDFHGYGVRTVYECDGHDYLTAKWLGASGLGVPLGVWKVDAIKLEPAIMGISFLTRKERTTVLVNGTVMVRAHRPDEDQENLREHKK